MNASRLLSADNIQRLNKGRRFYRVFFQGVSPKAYRDIKTDNPWRFTPFLQDKESNALVQGVYFAETPSACMRETLFRKGQSGVVPLNLVQQRQCIEVELKTDLNVYLMTSDLLQSCLGFDPVMNNDYPVCLSLARILIGKFPQLQGIVFQSYQTDANTLNLVAFSHQTSAADFRFKTSTRDDLLSQRYRSDLLAAASGAGRELSGYVRDICLGSQSL